MKPNIPFKLFANCVLVKGANRSTICDLQRNDVRIIPNDLHDLLVECEGKTIDEVKKLYGNKFDDDIDEYFEFLYENEFIFFSKQVDIFPKLSMEWSDSAIITNSIIDVDENSSYDALNVLKQLEELHCRHLEIRNFGKARTELIENILDFLNETESTIQSVEILLPFFSGIEQWLTSMKDKFLRVDFIRIYKSPKNQNTIPSRDCKAHLMYTVQDYGSELCCGKISQNFFVANMTTFTESMNYNSCLNRKLSIDKNGEIKNCPSMQKGFGSSDSVPLKNIINDKDFTHVWNTNKDKISTCKDCEFRHICTDCRAYLENPNDNLSKPLKCGYDPYTNEWSKWSTNPLKKESITYYNLQAVTEKP